MKGKNSKKTVDKTEEKPEVKEKIEEKKKEVHFCKDCKFYDHSSERKFYRKRGKIDPKTGERTVIMEIRGTCKNLTAKSCHHLVMAQYSKRQCAFWEEGKYKKKEAEKEKQTKDEEKTAPSEYFGPSLTSMERKEVKRNKKKQRLKNGEKNRR